MSSRKAVHSDLAPEVLGPYSQAIHVGNTVWLSGQIPLDPETGQRVEGDITVQTRRVFDNLRAVANATGGSLRHIVKVNISLTNLDDFAAVNEVMASYFERPYPARACVGVAALPRGTSIEVEAIMAFD